LSFWVGGLPADGVTTVLGGRSKAFLLFGFSWIMGVGEKVGGQRWVMGAGEREHD